ncbi:MAG: DUF4112 domain-containing protein [Halapricum sp.]
MGHSSTSVSEAATHPAVHRVHEVSRLLDEAVTVPGTDYKIGIDPILGILPVVGDSVATVFSLYILFEAARLGVDTRTLARMAAYVAVDAVVGSVPVVGTVFDAVWKANVWNADLLEAHVEADVSTTP